MLLTELLRVQGTRKPTRPVTRGTERGKQPLNRGQRHVVRKKELVKKSRISNQARKLNLKSESSFFGKNCQIDHHFVNV